VPEIVRELSDLADVCLDKVWDICHLQLTARQGRPYHQDEQGRWQETRGCILGMGKLGGRELNYSSDVDLLFVYSEEGSVFKEPPGKGKSPPVLLKNHQFFNRLAEMFIAEVTRLAPEGSLYRVDMRLRPEGDSGPLTRSLAGYENYYSQWGQTWERMMLIKTRAVAGDEALAAEFLEMVQPFRHPRSIQSTILQEVALMKDRIELEVVKAGEIERNVKLGRGGIREIEFVAQSMQLLHAGRQPFLQGAQTLPCLEKLANYELLTNQEAGELAAAYNFLRSVEHRLQMEDNRQTHTIPTARPARERLARLMSFGKLSGFEAALEEHKGNVRRAFDKVLKSQSVRPASSSIYPETFEGQEHRWKEILASSGFRDVDKALRVLREFVEGPGYVHLSRRTIALAHHLVPRLLALCPQHEAAPDTEAKTRSKILSDPDRVVTRLDSFIGAYGARSTLFELWNLNPAIFELLILLFDRSEFLAELAIRVPDLVDELVSSGRLRQRKTAEDTLRDLRHGLQDADQHLWLRRYHQTEFMRIGLRDILGLADPEQYLVELSALADACLQYALEVVMQRHRLKQPPFAVIGLGKLGGSEIDYGSDLDVVFVAGPKTKDLGAKSKLALEFLDLITRRTGQGMLFHMDARLRPDGEKGLLVNTLPAYEEYYRTRAQLWEIQSLTRARSVAGNLAVGAAFENLAAELSNFSRPSSPLAAFTPDWKAKIHRMRFRIEKERTPAGKDELAIKTGAGGLMDAEFIAQALCLENGWREPNTLRALERAKGAGCLPDPESLIENYRLLRRVEGILRRWSYEGETVLPDDPAPFYRVSVRCGFRSPEEFSAAIRQYRAAIRSVYAKFFAAEEASIRRR
jgi:glutamate-ammonia-ligase adenylyltransferase